MRIKTARLTVLSFAALFALAPLARAQGLVDAPRTREALSTFPDSQAVLFVNVQRVFRDVLPRLMPPAQLNKAIAEVKKNLDIDLRELDYAIVGVRLPDPVPQPPVPEFVVLVRGNFNADALVALAALGAGSSGVPSREEQHGGKTITLFRIQKESKPEEGEGASTGEGEAKPDDMGEMIEKSSPYPELAATALDTNTLLVGVPAFVKSALDASAGEGKRLRPDFIELAVNNPDALSSLTADVPKDLPKWLQKAGAPRNEEAEKVVGWLEQVSFSTGMTETDYTFNAALRADGEEHARALSGMIALSVRQVENGATKEFNKAKGAKRGEALIVLNVVKSITNLAQGDVVALSASIPQKTVAALVRKQMAARKSAAAASGSKAPGTTRRRRSRK